MQTAVRCHLTSVTMTIVKKQKTQQNSVREDVEELESLRIAGGAVKWFICYGKRYGDSSNC